MKLTKPIYYAAHVDYLRCSWRLSNEQPHLLHDLAWQAGQAAITPDGEPGSTRPGKLYGYVGVWYESVFVGRGPQGILLQASGVAADTLVQRVSEPNNVSRIDCAITAWYATDPAIHPILAYRSAKRYKSPVGGKPADLRLILNDAKGHTCYSGTRGKESKFIRVYNKGAQSGSEEYAGAIRWEVELSDGYARKAYFTLQELQFAAGACGSVVISECASRGIRVPNLDNLWVMPTHRLPRDKTALERRVAWLETGVRPSLDDVRAGGYSDAQIAKMLGLDV